MRSAREPRLQGLPARNALVNQYFEHKSSVILTTAEHKVLDEDGESRNIHRYAVVVQDLATQWIQSYPCKTKTSQETEWSLQKFLEPSEKPNVISSDNRWNLVNLVKIYHGIIVLPHLTDLRRMGLPKEQCAE